MRNPQHKINCLLRALDALCHVPGEFGYPAPLEAVQVLSELYPPIFRRVLAVAKMAGYVAEADGRLSLTALGWERLAETSNSNDQGDDT